MCAGGRDAMVHNHWQMKGLCLNNKNPPASSWLSIIMKPEVPGYTGKQFTWGPRESIQYTMQVFKIIVISPVFAMENFSLYTYTSLEINSLIIFLFIWVDIKYKPTTVPNLKIRFASLWFFLGGGWNCNFLISAVEKAKSTFIECCRYTQSQI